MPGPRQSPFLVFLSAIAIVLCLFLAPAVTAQENPVGQAVKALVGEAKQQVDSITIDELATLMAEGHEMNLIDVRTEAEYQAGHLHGARWIPRGMLEFDAAKGKVGSTDEEIIVYCKRDGRGALAAATLKRIGFTSVKYLAGGFVPWVAGGRSVYNLHGEITVTEFGKSEKEK